MQTLPALAVLAFAAYRVTQLIVWDSILDSWRQKIELWHAVRIESKARTFVRDLLKCTYCVSFHASWLTLLAYLLASGRWGDAPWFVHGIEAFAVAGASALLSRWDDTRPGI